MDENLPNSEFNFLPKKAKHTYLYNLLDYKNKTMLPFHQCKETLQDSRFIYQTAY